MTHAPWRRLGEGESAGEYLGLSPKLLAMIRTENLAGKRILDVGCGGGQLSLALAPEAGEVIGIDLMAGVIEQAAAAARQRDLRNVRFQVADAESEDYRQICEGPPDMVVARLCMSDWIVERAAAALSPGACLIFAAFHTDQWKETGRVSRFAYSEEQITDVLHTCGFVPEEISLERDVTRFSSMEKALASAALRTLREKWEADGRWEAYRDYLAEGGRMLTRSHLLVKARRGQGEEGA